MGLDAYVACRCWADGLASPPPVDAARVIVEGGLPELHSGELDVLRAFDIWRAERACAHPDMMIVEQRIANWYGYRLFEHALQNAGPAHVPVLLRELPQANGGHCPALASRVALIELRWFVEHAVLPPETRLVAEDTGVTMHRYVAAWHGEVMWSSTGVYGVDPEGFFIRTRPHGSGEELFRATRVRQHDLGDGRVRFTDPDTGRSVTVPDGMLVTDATRDVPERLHVVRTPVTAEDFRSVVDALTVVFRASADTGNPVYWT